MRQFKKPPVEVSKINFSRLNFFRNNGLIKANTPEEVAKKHEAIYEFICDRYDNMETRRAYVNTIIDQLKRVDDPDDKLILYYNDIAFNLCEDRKKKYAENKPINSRRETLEKYDYDYLSNVIVELNDKFMDDKKNMSEQEHLLLTILYLNMLQPPLRSEICEMRFVDDKEGKLNMNKLKENTLVKNNIGQYYYVLVKYKAKKTDEHRIIKLKNSELKKFLNRSFKAFPRSYVLGINEPLGYYGYRSILSKRFAPGFSVDCLRSLYISKFMSSNPSLKMRQEVAFDMLHSTSAQQMFYNKVVEEGELPEVKL